jgi:hypothetical protein
MERRTQQRSYIEPYDTGTYLEFMLDGREYRCNLLDTSPGGMGMLVKKNDAAVLQKLKNGDRIHVRYWTPEARMPMDVEISHTTFLKEGKFKNHYQVGLCLFQGPESHRQTLEGIKAGES